MKKLFIINLFFLINSALAQTAYYEMQDCSDQTSREFAEAVMQQVKYGLEDQKSEGKVSIDSCNSFWIAELFDRPTAGWGDENCGVKVKFTNKSKLIEFANYAKIFDSSRRNMQWINNQNTIANVQVCGEI